MTHQSALKYGAFELRALYPRFAFRALVIASIIHVSIIGSYYAATSLTGEEERSFIIRRIPVNEMEPPPSIRETRALPGVSIAARPSIGIPSPIPDAEISPEATIPTQAEMNQPIVTDESGTDQGGTIIVAVPGILEGESEPDLFTPVEKLPVPVVNPAPDYPEIARRAGIQGTVWVRIWVTKEGRAKKAEVLKSDSDLFDRAALDAAMNWVFTPAVMNSGPVAVWVSIPFKFRLHQMH